MAKENDDVGMIKILQQAGGIEVKDVPELGPIGHFGDDPDGRSDLNNSLEIIMSATAIIAKLSLIRANYHHSTSKKHSSDAQP
jgi:hypothetical protein